MQRFTTNRCLMPPAKRGCMARCIAMSIICSGILSTTPLTMTALCRLKESALPLTPEAKEVVDRVLDTFGMYSGKVLESITHKEAPWLDARKGFLPDETSHAEISLDAMKSYFKKVDEKYNIRTEDGLRKYIAKMR